MNLKITQYIPFAKKYYKDLKELYNGTYYAFENSSLIFNTHDYEIKERLKGY
jgi:hypothetical protein